MDSNNMSRVWTPDEIAEYLKVDRAIVLEEFENGNLVGFKIGSEWRCLETDLMTYVSRGKTGIRLSEAQTAKAPEVQRRGDFLRIASFNFRWPMGEEHFDEVYETTRQIDGRTFTFRIGFGDRPAAGRLRKRVVIWLGNYPLVEFAGSDDYEFSGLLASVIKSRGGRQVLLRSSLPDEYEEFDVRSYNSIVRGPYASGNLAVVVHKNDLETMLRHAIIRAKWKGLI